ncbi:MAG: SRPBCC family protein [Gemmatimonadota bacterium]|nr:SRPBCC family protein [Gemmatimonadota bacterium]
MHTHNEIFIRAHPDVCLTHASDVEAWPEILPHYREVFFTRRDGEGAGRVVMKAYRHFGPLPYPIWWESEMVTDAGERTVRYRHVGGITRGMDVEWRIEPEDGGARVTIVHDWDGPAWPLIGGPAARWVIGPRFIHVVADRTLRGVKAAAEGAR